MDIAPSYMERQWIYFVRAILSSLHHKLKFVIRNKVVSIDGEEDIIVATSTDTLYAKLDEGIPEPSLPPMLKKYRPWLSLIC